MSFSLRVQLRLLGPLFAALCVLPAQAQAPPAAGQVPRTLAEVPLVPGAERTEEPGPECAKYSVRKPIEDVVKFYAQRWQAREAPSTRGSHGELQMQAPEFDAALERLRAGQTTTVFFTVGFWLPELFQGYIREGLPSRPPYRPNQWIQVAEFHWARADTQGNVKRGTLELEDTSAATLLLGPKGQQTLIAPCVIAYGTTAEEMEKEEASAEKEEPGPREQPAAEEREKPSVKPLSEKELGMPIYPGARFDAQMSAGMSGEAEKYYVYLTNDPVTKVVTFYEAKTGKKAEPGDAGSYQIAVKGKVPWPELGVVIQPVSEASLPQYLGTAKTAFTIRKVAAKEPD